MSEQDAEIARLIRLWDELQGLDGGGFRRVMRYLESRHGTMMQRRKTPGPDHRLMEEADL